MKIKYILNSVDDSDYLKIWPYTAKFTKKIDFIPVLFHITNNDTEFYFDNNGLIKKIKAVEGVPTWQQAQLARIWGSKFFENDCVMTSDIDMFPLNKNYFVDSINNYSDNCFINLTSNAYKNEARIPICYNVATGQTFKKLLKLDCSFKEFLNRVISIYGISWESDERYTATNVLNYPLYVGLYRHFNEKWEAENRLDRNTWNYDSKNKDKYIDCHFLRPFDQHRDKLEILLKEYAIE